MANRDLAAAITLVKQLQPALQRRDRITLVDLIGQLVSMKAPLGDQWQSLAHMAMQYGELGLARRAIDLFVEARGSTPQAQYLKAALLEQSGALKEAYALMCALPETVPDRAAHAFSRGTAALFLGETAEARARLEQATALRPQSGPAWLSLAMAVDFAGEAELAERVIAAERQVDMAVPAQAAAYFYAQGKAHAERGSHEAAFAAFARGAGLMKAAARYDRHADRANAGHGISGYTAEGIAAIAGQQSEDTARTIFVMGTARSGTTLVEQILTSHSDVSDGGEINRFYLLGNEIGGRSFDILSAHVKAHGVARAAQLWRHWVAERCPGPGRVVDKTLSTTRFIGLAAALLPEAPLIWMTRDPLDRAWSCFRTYFPVSMNWSYDFADIAHFFRLEDELLARWQAILGERLLVVPYEQLVSDPDRWIRRILAHCRLAEEPQVFAPHEAGRKVTTASVMQVRRPINRAAMGAAEPYRPFLQTFIDAYSA